MVPIASKSLMSAASLLLLIAAGCTPQGARRPFPGPQALPIGATGVQADSVPGIPGFSSGIKRGLVIYVSGQVSLDSAARLIGPGNLRAQVTQSLGNLFRVVKAGRGLPGDVVKLTFYVVGLDSSAATIVQDAAHAMFPEEPAPAVTIVGVSSLPGAGFLVAVDGVAVLRGEFPDRERPARPEDREGGEAGEPRS